MAEKSTKSKSTPKTDARKSSPKVKDLAPKKDPRGGSTDHSPKKGNY